MCTPGSSQQDGPRESTVSLNFKQLAYLDSSGSVISVAEVVGLVTEAAAQVLAIGEKTSCSGTDVLIHRLYPSIRTLHKKLGVKKALDSQDDAIGAADTHGHSVRSQSRRSSQEDRKAYPEASTALLAYSTWNKRPSGE